MIEWNDTLKTGHTDVDADHCGLIALINTLERDLQNRTAAHSIRDAIQQLREYIHGHFEREEARMLEVGCPAYARNRAEHIRFTQRLDGWAQRLENEGPSLSLAFDVYHGTGNWFASHIPGTDCELRGCTQTGRLPTASSCR
jgi:hemerythrin-like metal-binding protein